MLLEDVYIGDLQGDTLITLDELRINGVRIHPRARILKLSTFELRGGRFALATHDVLEDLHPAFVRHKPPFQVVGKPVRSGASFTVERVGTRRVKHIAIQDHQS